MNLFINAKLLSVSEPNQQHTFEPNVNGLYNISELFRIFNTIKETNARHDSALLKHGQDFTESTVEAYKSASNAFLQHMSEALDLRFFNDQYWGTDSAFYLCLKSCSDMFADAANVLEKAESLTNGEYATCLVKKYSVFRPASQNMEGYRAYCIFSLAELTMDFEFVYDFTLANMVAFDKAATHCSRNDNEYHQMVEKLWFMAFQQIHALIAQTFKIDPNLRDSESFFVRYREMLQHIKQQTDNFQAPFAPATISNPRLEPKKEGFFSRLFK